MNIALGLRLSTFLLFCFAFFSIQKSSAADQPNIAAVSEPKTTGEDRQCIASNYLKLLKASYDFNEPATRDFPIEIAAQPYRLESYAADKTLNSSNNFASPEIKRAPEGGRIILKLIRPGGINSDDWQKSYLVGISITNKRNSAKIPIQINLTSMPVIQKDSDNIIVDALLPGSIGEHYSEDWTVIPVLCGGSNNKVLGYASTKLTLVSTTYAWIISIIVILFFWFIISYAAWQLNKSKLDALWSKYDGIFKHHPDKKFVEYVWKVLESANPVFISQDSLGFGSLARFQILIFTTVVGLVLSFIFIHSGVLSNISNTVLLLLGVTVAGGTFARATGDWLGISPASRQWLLGTNVLKSQSDKPRWSDLFETQGEIDVAKLQALLFTSLISVGILASGLTGLSSFSLPEQVVYLAMISQGTYVFGKLLPADSRKKVEEDLSNLREKAAVYSSDIENDKLKMDFELSRETAKRTLQQTYADRFDEEEYDKITITPKLRP